MTGRGVKAVARERGGAALARASFPVVGLGCGGGGALTVERALREVAGVRDAYVNPADGSAHVSYDPGACTVEDLTAAVARMGYRAGR